MKESISKPLGAAAAAFIMSLAINGAQAADSLDNRVLFDFEDQSSATLATDNQTPSPDLGYIQAGSFAPAPAYSTAQAYSGVGSLLFTSNSFNDRVVISNTIAFTGDFTVSMFLRPTELPPSTGQISMSLFSKALNPDLQANFKLALVNSGGNTYFRYHHYRGPSLGETLVWGTTPIVTDIWQQVAVVRSNGTVRLYLNGVADSALVTTDTAITPASLPSYLGYTGVSYSNDKGYLGYMDYVYIDNRALSPQELAALPEPTALAFCGLGAMMLLLRRR